MTTSCIDRTEDDEARWIDVILDDLVDQLGAPFGRRLFLAGAAGVATLGFTACGGNSTTEAPPATGSAGFPVTVQGKEGTATIPQAPQRVIALGFQRDADTALALGVIPIAMTASSSFTSRIAPWTESKLRDPKPELLDDTDGTPFEKIASLRPDLILATDNFELADGYARLTQIAPTVSYLQGPNDDTWQQRTTHIGKALGRDEQARKIITDTETKVAQAARDNPDFAGKTVSVSTKFGPDVFTVLKGDSAMTFLEQLGLQTSPEVAALPESSTPGRALVSQENLGVLAADVMIVTYQTDDARTSFESSPVFQQLDAVKNGAYIPLDFPVAFSLGFPSPLAIPYGLDRTVAAVAKVLRG